MKRISITLILIFCIYTVFGQPVLSGTWDFQYQYCLESYPLIFEVENEVVRFGMDVQLNTGEFQNKTIGTMEFIDDELVKVTFLDGESKKYFYAIKKAKSGAWGSDEIIPGYYGLILNKGEIVIGFKDTEEKNEYLFMCVVDYFKCIGHLIKQVD